MCGSAIIFIPHIVVAAEDGFEWHEALRVRCNEAVCEEDTFFHYSSPTWFTNETINADADDSVSAVLDAYLNVYVTHVKLIMGNQEVIIELKESDKGVMTLQDLVTKDGRLASSDTEEGSIERTLPSIRIPGQNDDWSYACTHWGMYLYSRMTGRFIFINLLISVINVKFDTDPSLLFRFQFSFI